jgi:hypothetical protein
MVCSITSGVKAQSNVDANFLFKMWLFSDRESNNEFSKSDSLFIAFSTATELKLDKIECDLFGISYHFYFLRLYDIKNNKFINNVSYSRTIASNEIKNFIIPVNKYIGQYVISVNPKTGRSYRLSGFNGNDFLGFLSDFKEVFNQKNKSRLSNKEFLKKYYVEGIDFNCLYRGLKAKKIDKKNYPCLIRCSDPVSIH